ncbi:MATE family efflux transporter [Oscillibacter sp. MSJ-2]|uniref:MATE family efflux transporter n=1 Tax=Dysosmobacter acutus TaxID=2841504 RepID=A0ABS6F876_9FIRM|nr:MATE family efflux transporter [Dysosmobacter acutus]MBU5626493.1 MATE family efflux transporter [Dysosmobacter acutus]
MKPHDSVDFTQGNITPELIWFAIPIMLSELFQNLYNSVDSLVVGNFVGQVAIGAVSVCGTLSYLLIGFFTGVSVGTSVIISRAFGKQDKAGLNECVQVAFSFSVVLGVILSCIGIVFTPALLRLAAVPEEAWSMAAVYLRIYLAGIMFTIIYNVGAGILRAIGDSRSPFYILLIACTLNIGLDLLFTALLMWGVAGVALATVCAQAVSVVLVYRKIGSVSENFSLSFRKLRGAKGIIAEIMGVSFPAGLQNSLISLSNLFVWRYVNKLNTAAMAGVGIAQRLDRFIAIPSRAIALALTTLVSQNDGAAQFERINEGLKKSVALAMSVTLVFGAALYMFSDRIAGWFNSEPGVTAVATAMMRTIIPFYCLMAIREVGLGMMRGYGDTKVPMVLSLIGMVVVRQVYLAISMEIDYNIAHIYYCYPITWGVTVLMMGIHFIRNYKNGRPGRPV